MEECRHSMFGALSRGNCDICNRPEEFITRAKRKPKRPSPQKQPKHDPWMRKAVGIAEHRWCARCNTPIWQGKCHCIRMREFGWDYATIIEEAEAMIAENQQNRRFAVAYASKMLWEAICRAGIRDHTVNGFPLFGAYLAELKATLGDAPKWSPPRSSAGSTNKDPAPTLRSVGY